ncbi:MAG: autotransporter outer membrane beta-barrel domain-containing protein [Thiobacillus sp.]|nr:autotransporter outer membrane beta-barrel domain-containing protein [Thiobacillus sp.]
MTIRSNKPARTTARALTLACMGAALGLAGSANAVSYTVAGITVSSSDAGFSQPSANTFYFPTGAGVTTFTFGDGRGFTLTNSEQNNGQSSNRNIVGIPAAGNVINAIAGQGYNSVITLRDALSGATLVSDQYTNLSAPSGGPFGWFEPTLILSYLNGTLTVNAVGDIQQINADGSISYDSQDAPILIGSYLLFSAGPSAVDTQASLQLAGQRMRSVFDTAINSTNFANMNTYDCDVFGENGWCVSGGVRYTNVNSPDSETTSAVLVAGYRISPQFRIGGFLDQGLNHDMPAGINMHNKIPLLGVFGVWNQNADELGWQVKLANAYQVKDVDITREVVGTSEAGTGSVDLTTESYVGVASYALMYGEQTLIRPYLALRYTKVEQEGYTETGVTTPLTFAPLTDRSTTALLGVKLEQALTPQTTLKVSLGIEHDLDRDVDTYSATGVTGLTSESFSNSFDRTRPVAAIGADYAISRTQVVTADLYYQQQPFESTGSTTFYLNYTVGF